MKREEALAIIAEKLPKKRYEHSKRVAETALGMAEIFEVDKTECELAGILHDYSKYDDLSEMYQYVNQYQLDPELLSFNGEVLHGPVAAAIMYHSFGVEDEAIFQAISHHTSGRSQMGLIEKIIFVADYIEPERAQPGVDDIRKLIFEDRSLDAAIYEISKANLLHLISKNSTVYHKTVECYNYYNMVKE